MDANGARHLVARLRAGVRVGTRVELAGDADGACAGDKGFVVDIFQSGRVLVALDRGLTLEVEPGVTALRPLG
jgi:hypothetical protein